MPIQAVASCPSYRFHHNEHVEAELREATTAGAVDVHLQPIVSLPDGRLVRVEALARWRRPDGTWVPPREFIAVADRTGLIVELGAHILDRSCALAAGWHRAGQAAGVSVNVSARQLDDPDFARRVLDTLDRHGVSGGALGLEITESAIVRDPAWTAGVLHTLRSHGVRIALDDFGTGSSSLTLLRQLPVDVLKIDQSFVEHVTDQPRDAVLVRMLTDAAHALGLAVCAEGVETLDQARQLTALGVEHAQGWAFGRPLAVTSEGRLPECEWSGVEVDPQVPPALPLGAAEDIVVVTDTAGVILYASPTAGERLGVSPAGLVGRSVARFVHPDDRALLRRGSGRVTVRMNGNARSGWRTWEIFASADRLQGGDPEAETLWLCRDVTAALEAQASMHEQQELFRLSFEGSPVGMAVSRLDGTLVQVNDAFAVMLEATPDQVLGSSVASWTHPDDRDVDSANTAALLAGTATTHTVAKRFVSRTGTVLSVSVIATAVTTRDGPQWVVAHVVPRATG